KPQGSSYYSFCVKAKKLQKTSFREKHGCFFRVLWIFRVKEPARNGIFYERYQILYELPFHLTPHLGFYSVAQYFSENKRVCNTTSGYAFYTKFKISNFKLQKN